MGGTDAAGREPEGSGGWVLVLDIGTSSVRAWLYDAEGRGVDPGPEAQRRHSWRTPSPDAMEADAAALAGRVAEAVDAAVARARAAGLEIVAVAIASFWHSLLGLDAAGAPATPLFAFGDSRAAGTALRLRDQVDEAEYHARTGCFLHPSYPAVKLAWLRAEDPAAFARVARWVSFPEYLERLLFGEARCSFSMASGTGLLDVHRLRWDAGALEMAGIAEARLSPLVESDAALRGLRPAFATRWPELARLPWFPALGDGACANVGSGAVGTARFGVTVGTTAAARVVWAPKGPVEIPDAVWCYRLDRRYWVAGGALSNGGNAVAFLRRFIRLPDEREWEAAVGAMEPDSHGLTVLPFLVDERGPGWQLEREALVAGLSQATGTEQLLRAWMEAVAYRIGDVVRRLERVAGAPREVRASGGALHASRVWAQILADVLGRELTLPVEREATARGAALVALERLGALSGLTDTPYRAAARFVPDAGRHARYQDAARRQQALGDAVAGWLQGDRRLRADAPTETNHQG